MIDRVTVRTGAYHDSVTLMLVSRDAGALDGVCAASAVMGTPLNLALLARQGFVLEAGAAGPNDLVIALRTDAEEAAVRATAAVDARLARSQVTDGDAAREPPRSVLGAARRRPGLSLAFLSVPGRNVTYEAATALRAGLDVFCFSDGVGLEDEALLKRTALERGLLFMGPDCGTAIIDGVALGFANAVERGPVGIVGASGTGVQQVTCLLDAAGVGISHAIGVGGRDLTSTVGGQMTERALELLADDDATEVIAVVSKPPDHEVAGRIAATAASVAKPVVLALVGPESPPAAPDGVTVVNTLESAAATLLSLCGRPAEWGDPEAPPAVTGGYVRGLFCGGTLCEEALTIVAGGVGRVTSNVAPRPDWQLADANRSEGHTFLDLGDDIFTEGRAHPMIDPGLRAERLVREASDPGVGVVLIDVVLGHCAHPDPAGAVARALEQAYDRRTAPLTVVASLCGTDRDPQGLASQRATLERVGAVVARSNAQAARLALASIGDAAAP